MGYTLVLLFFSVSRSPAAERDDESQTLGSRLLLPAWTLVFFFMSSLNNLVHSLFLSSLASELLSLLVSKEMKGKGLGTSGYQKQKP